MRLVLCLFLVAGAFAMDPAFPASAIESEVNALFAPWARNDSPGCALAASRDGRIVLERGYGMADLEQSVAIGPDSVFNIASISKQFTATAILLLAQDGRLSLHDDIRAYVPEMPDYGRTITIRHLGNHTSGLRDHPVLLALSGWNWLDAVSDSRILDLLARQKHLNFLPGEEYRYSNSGFFLLALIVERVSGRTLAEFAMDRIFRPLGMQHSRFYDDRRMIVKRRAVGHVAVETGGFGVWRPTYEVVGDGGLLTTVRDMTLWERNFIEPRLGRDPAHLVKTLVTPGRLNDDTKFDYGFGLAVGEYRSAPIVFHGGNIPGYAAYMLQFPEHRFSIHVQCNLGGLPARRLATSIADLYLEDAFGESPPEPVQTREDSTSSSAISIKISKELLAEFSGRFYSEELDATYDISVSEAGMTVRVGHLPSIHLRPVAHEIFESEDGVRLSYSRGRDNAVDGYDLEAHGVSGLRFIRQESRRGT